MLLLGSGSSLHLPLFHLSFLREQNCVCHAPLSLLFLSGRCSPIARTEVRFSCKSLQILYMELRGVGGREWYLGPALIYDSNSSNQFGLAKCVQEDLKCCGILYPWGACRQIVWLLPTHGMVHCAEHSSPVIYDSPFGARWTCCLCRLPGTLKNKIKWDCQAALHGWKFVFDSDGHNLGRAALE